MIAGFIGFGFVCTQKYCSQNHIMNKELKWIMLNKIDIFIKIFCVCVCVLCLFIVYSMCMLYISRQLGGRSPRQNKYVCCSDVVCTQVWLVYSVNTQDRWYKPKQRSSSPHGPGNPAVKHYIKQHLQILYLFIYVMSIYTIPSLTVAWLLGRTPPKNQCEMSMRVYWKV